MRAKPSKAPALTVIHTTISASSPPQTFGKAGYMLWRTICAEHELSDGQLLQLTQACIAADRAEQLAEKIALAGVVIETDAGPRSHGAIKDELQLRAFVSRSLQKLCGQVRPVGRPGRGFGWTGDDDK